MIVTAMLTHCSEVTVYPPPGGGPPLVGPVEVTAGGAAGDGTVTVTTTPPSSPPVAPVGTGGTSLPFDGTGITEIKMHYFADPAAPQVVEVTIAPPPPAT